MKKKGWVPASVHPGNAMEHLRIIMLESALSEALNRLEFYDPNWERLSILQKLLEKR